MSLVGCLARHAQGLGDLLPRPLIVNRAFHRLPFHAVGELAESDDRRERGGGVIRGGRHADTLGEPRRSVNLC